MIPLPPVETLSQVFNTLSNGIILLDRQKIEWTNRAFLTLFHIEEGSLEEGANIIDFIDESDRARVTGYLNSMEKTSSNIEMQLPHPHKKAPFVEIAFTRYDPSNPLKRAGIARPVSPRPVFNLSHKRRKKRSSQRKLIALGEVTVGVAHDFNNLLTTILGRLTTTRIKLGQYEPIEGELSIIEAAAENAQNLVLRITEFTKDSSKRTNWEEIQLDLLLAEAVFFSQTMLPPGVQIISSLMPVPIVAGCRHEILEVFLNILNNAIDAVSADGLIKVSSTTQNGTTLITITDNGPGIPENLHDKIFEPYFSTKKEQGTGIGLSVSHEILQRHNVNIQVTSSANNGTTFQLLFPPLADLSARRLRTGELSIRIIDDDSGIAEMLKDLLKEDNHRVEVISDIGFLDSIDYTTSIDLLITDLDLKITNGWEVAKKTRLLSPETVIGLMTGWSVNLSQEELRLRGVDFVLHKPFTLTTLTEALKSVGYAK